MMKKSILLIVAFYMPVIGPVYSAAAADGVIELSAFNMTTGYFDTPAELLITDSQGRRTGYSPSAPFNKAEQLNMYREIPGGMYHQDGIGSSSDENPTGVDDSGFSNFRRLRLQGVTQGIYLLQIIGRETGQYGLDGTFEKFDGTLQFLAETPGFIVQGQTTTLSINYDPTPGTPAPVITKTVTFDVLRQDLTVAQQLKQLGDDKFVRSLINSIDLAERLLTVCDKRKHNKDKDCEPAIAVLKLFIKRLEKANQKCDSKKPHACDEDKDWDDFDKEHRKDHDYEDFFRDWDRDDWHKHKKQCKRFITDEALKIIKEDAQWLIKSLGGEIEKDRDDHHGGKEKGR
jgi:hypothetical protein